MIDTSRYDYCWKDLKANLTTEETLTCLTASLAVKETLGYLQNAYANKFDQQVPTLHSGMVDSCDGY